IESNFIPSQAILSTHLVNISRRGGLNPPECIKQIVFGQIQSAPTVDESVTEKVNEMCRKNSLRGG
ncbi:MAG: hypothetical protein LUI85_11000, partial [Bacteroides sp.]|nr:hypothetical protein [Bacteroides sp.]